MNTVLSVEGVTFETIFKVGSKADKRAEYALQLTIQEYLGKFDKLEQVLELDGFKALELETSANKMLGRYLTKYYLTLDEDVKKHIKTDLIKLLLREVSLYELPLNSLVEQIQLRWDHLFTGDLALKHKYAQGEVSNMFASIIAGMGLTLGLFRITKKEAKVTADKGYKHEYQLVHPTLALTESQVKYLHKKTFKEPKNYAPELIVSGSEDEMLHFSGDSIKHTRSQPQYVWNRLSKISSMPYQINERMWEKFAPLFRQTFPTMQEAKKFDAVVEANLGKPLYFDAKYTADNGRINLVGYYLGAQVGARNHLIEVHEDYKEALTEKDVKRFQKLIKALEGKTSLKDKLERLAYLQALEDHANGLKVGVLVDFDGKLSGQQGMAVLCKSKQEARFSGMLKDFDEAKDDGYRHLGAITELEREPVKGGMNPYQYGAGKDTTLAGIREEGGIFSDFAKWEQGFEATFPASFKLMKYIQTLSRKADLGYTMEYTTPVGFKASITSYETFSTKYNNLFGKDRLHHIKVVKSNDFGAQPVAAGGHFMDASVLATVIDGFDGHLLPVHDNFRCMIGHTDEILELHMEANRYFLTQPLLETYINQAFAPYLDYLGIQADVSGLLKNTLTPEDIVGGLF